MDDPSAHKGIQPVSSRTPNRKVNSRGQENEIVAQANFVRVEGLPIESPKVILRFFITNRSFDYRCHGW